MTASKTGKDTAPPAYPAVAALAHPLLGRTAVLAVGITMVCAFLAGILEGLYFSQQEIVSAVENYALIFVVIGLCIVLALLVSFSGEFLDRLALSAFVIAIVYIFLMLTSALFLDGDIPRSLHAVMWFHPAFIAVTLTQPIKMAQSACWLVIALLCGVMIYFSARHAGAVLGSTALVNHWIIILSLCATSALLYGLSIFRENQGASAARIEMLEEYSAVLQAEAEVKDRLNDELAQANAVVASFLDNMSHELRTPLNAIIGFSELIHGEIFGALANEKYKEYAGDILGSGHSLLDLVNNLLYFSKLSAGKISLNPEPLDARDLIIQIADAQRAKAENAQISIVTDVVGRPILEGDPHAVSRILKGLLDNAIKFSDSGSSIYLNATQRSDGACEIFIRDTGMGISKVEQEKVFAPFRKGVDSKQQALPGIGLGLSTAKMLMDLHGGSLSIDSTKDAGTSVMLIFPALSHHAQTAKRASAGPRRHPF